MSTRTIKRGTRPRAVAAKGRGATRKVRRVSAVDRMIRAVPLNPTQWQQLMTVTIIAVLGFVMIAVARSAGLPAIVQTQFAALAARTGFEVKRVEVTGIDRVDELAIYDIVLAEKNRAMPAVDLGRIRNDLMTNGWIADARVTRRLPDTLAVEIVERKPAAMWDDSDRLSLIDARGVVLELVEGMPPSGLIVLEGPDANRRTLALGELLDQAPALKPQVVRARWIGNRRWDLEFRSGETLALPEGARASAKALLNFARMDGVSRLLGRDIIHFDMRDPDRAYLRRVPATPGSAATASSESGG